MTRGHDYRLIMSVIVGWCPLGLAGAIWPVVNQVVGAIVLAALVAAGVAVVGYVVREVWREVAFWRRVPRPVRDEEREQVSP
jgi:hypothetical protein